MDKAPPLWQVVDPIVKLPPSTEEATRWQQRLLPYKSTGTVPVFKAAPAEDREKLQVLRGMWLKEYAKADAASLKETMNEINRKAQNRWLTPEVLNSILKEE